MVEAVAAVERITYEEPNESFRQRTKQLELCASILSKTLRNDLGLRPYQI